MVDPSQNGGLPLSKRDRAALPRREALGELSTGMDHLPRLQPTVRRIYDKPQPRNPVLDRLHLSRVLVNGQPESLQPLDQGGFPLRQLRLGLGEQRHIVDIADVSGAAQFPRHKLVHRVEIAIGPELGRQVPNRQTARPQRGPKIIAGEPHHLILLLQNAVTASQNFCRQRQNAGIVEMAPENGEEHRMVNRWEVLYDIQPQDVTVTPGKGLELVDRAMGPLAAAVGVAMGMKEGLKNGRHDVAERVVDDAVSEGGRADAAAFGRVDRKMDIGAGDPGAGVKRGLDGE